MSIPHPRSPIPRLRLPTQPRHRSCRRCDPGAGALYGDTSRCRSGWAAAALRRWQRAVVAPPLSHQRGLLLGKHAAGAALAEQPLGAALSFGRHARRHRAGGRLAGWRGTAGSPPCDRARWPARYRIYNVFGGAGMAAENPGDRGWGMGDGEARRFETAHRDGFGVPFPLPPSPFPRPPIRSVRPSSSAAHHPSSTSAPASP